MQLFLLWKIASRQLKFPTCYTYLVLPTGEYECISDVALFTMIRQMARLYVHARRSQFYDPYHADIFSIDYCSEIGNGEKVEIAP